jgi:hypothetical protein
MRTTPLKFSLVVLTPACGCRKKQVPPKDLEEQVNAYMAYFDERTKAEKEAAKNKMVDDDGLTQLLALVPNGARHVLSCSPSIAHSTERTYLICSRCQDSSS